MEVRPVSCSVVVKPGIELDSKSATRVPPRSVASLVFACAAGSVLGVFARALDADLTVVQQVSLRCTLGVLLLVLVVGPRTVISQVSSASRYDIAVASGRGVLLYAIGVTLSAYSFIHGNYAISSMILALPVVAVVSAALFGDRPTTGGWLLVSAAFCGAAIIALARASTDSGDALALLAAFAAAVCMSVGLVGQRAQRQSLAPIATAVVMLAVAAGITAAASGAVQAMAGSGLPGWDRLPTVLLLGVGAALLSTGNLLANNYGIPRVDGVVANNVMSLQPVFGIVVAAAVYGETLTVIQLGGAVVVLVSVLLLSRANRTRKQRQA